MRAWSTRKGSSVCGELRGPCCCFSLSRSPGNIRSTLALHSAISHASRDCYCWMVAVPAVLQAGGFRRPGPLQWLTLAFYLWFCGSLFWTAVPDATLMKLRSYFQEMMIVWLVWEFGESPRDVRDLMRAWLAGSWVLAILTIANFAFFDPNSADQIRFAAFGQDPNDVARFLDLGFPIAALLLDGRERWPGKLLAAGYLPLGFVCVLLTASRGRISGCGCRPLWLRRAVDSTLPQRLVAGSARAACCRGGHLALGAGRDFGTHCVDYRGVAKR